MLKLADPMWMQLKTGFGDYVDLPKIIGGLFQTDKLGLATQQLKDALVNQGVLGTAEYATTPWAVSAISSSQFLYLPLVQLVLDIAIWDIHNSVSVDEPLRTAFDDAIAGLPAAMLSLIHI